MNQITPEQIENLVQLQQTDREIRRISLKIDEFPLTIDTLEAEVQEQEKTVLEVEEQVISKRKKYRELDRQVQENQNRINKSNDKLPSVKTNKEYQAILKEIEELKRKNSLIEDEMLEYLDFFEDQEQAVVKQKDAFEKYKARMEAEKKTLIERKTVDEERLAQLKLEHGRIAEKVKPALLKTYHAIRSYGHNTVISEVKNSACQGCHVNIPPQLYNELQKGGHYTFCHNCQRMIYYKVS